MIQVMGSSTQYISTIIQDPDTNFSVKDLGHLHYFIGIKATHTYHDLHLTQIKYIEDLLRRAKFDTCKPIPILILPRFKSHGHPLSAPIEYCNGVDALLYICLT